MNLNDARILVTGAGGMIGSNLLTHLAAKGQRLRATVRGDLPPPDRATVEFQKLDLTRPDDCAAAVADIDCVFHCAGVVHGAGGDQLAAVAQNTAIHTQMLDAAHRAGVRTFVWLASTVAYADTGSRPVLEHELHDGTIYEKYQAVGSMYRHLERLCEDYGARGMNVAVLRPTNVYGPGAHTEWDRAHVATALLRRVVERQDPMEIWGSGNDVRDFVYVDDVARAMVLAAERARGHIALNVGAGVGHSVNQLLHTLLDLEGFTPRTLTFDASKPSTIPVRLVDVRAAERALGFRAAIDLREGLRRTLVWYKSR